MAVPQKDKIFVAVQFLLFIAWLFEVEAWYFTLSKNLQKLALFIATIGFILVLISLFQLKSFLSPFPSPKKGSKLITSGAFAFARHPIYSGILFMAFGVSIWLGSGYKLAISTLLFFLFYFKSQYEEQKLIQVFPNYLFYKKNTGRFFPKFKGRI